MDWGGASKFARRYSSLGCQLLKDKRHGLKIDAHRMGLTEQVHPKISAAYEAYIQGRGYLQEYEKPENVDSAIAAFKQALKIDPNYALAYAGLGKAYLTGFQQFDKGQQWVANASANCEKALSLNSGLLEGHICLGDVLNGTGKYDKAVEEGYGEGIRE